MSVLGLLASCLFVTDAEVDERRKELTDVDGDGVPSVAYGGLDCDDGDPTIRPGREETCDEVDQDCDGLVDEGVGTPWYPDADGDGFGASEEILAAEACSQPSGFVADATDCDDGDAEVNPEADESCNGVDDDCDGAQDEDDAVDAATWHVDGDGDGYGDDTQTATACERPEGHAEVAGDCDDSSAAVSPDGLELVGDDSDGDCDGDDDGFRFQALDTRGASGLLGPRLVLLEDTDELLLGWAGAGASDGSLEPAFVSVFATDGLQGEELDHLGTAATEDLGDDGGLFDLVASELYVGWARAFTESGERSVRLDAASRWTGEVGSVAFESTGAAFDDLFAGLSTDGLAVLVTCGSSARLEVNYGPLADAQAGSAEAFTQATEDREYDTCAYDAILSGWVYASAYAESYDLYVTAGTRLVQVDANSGSDLLIQDIDVGVQHDLQFDLVAGVEDNESLYFYAQDLLTDAYDTLLFDPAESLVEVDGSATTGGVIAACAIDDDGGAWLVLADPIHDVLSAREVELEPGLSAEDCAIAVSADGIASVAIRGGDDLVAGRVQLP